MATHRLENGKRIIALIKKLGKILNYYVGAEAITEKENHSAVDVGWFYEEGQDFPLMIFEIESKTTNSIVANPLKVYSETNRKFEKPLFFFHIILSGGRKSSKIQQLENQFGTHNYRIYRFSINEETQLLKDILSQHRRLTNSLDIPSLISEISSNWKEIDLDEVVNYIENIGFEKNSGNILPYYANISQLNIDFRRFFVRYLDKHFLDKNFLYEGFNYNTYFGKTWAFPIHTGILISCSKGNEKKKGIFKKFKWWQEKSWYFEQIGPYFGLSRDYDQFILGLSGAFLNLLAVLMKDIPESQEYLTVLLKRIVDKSVGNSYKVVFYNALWLLYLSAQNPKTFDIFNSTKDYINRNGGLPQKLFDSPPSSIFEIFEDGENPLDSCGKFVMVPEVKYFSYFNSISKEKVLNFAFNLLLDDNAAICFDIRLLRND